MQSKAFLFLHFFLIGLGSELFFSNCCFVEINSIDGTTGRKINFFSGSHLAPKYFKVVANSKKVGGHYDAHTNNFYPVTVPDRLNF